MTTWLAVEEAMNQKYEKITRYCTNCFRDRSIIHFSMINLKTPRYGWQPICKPCRTDIEVNRQQERLLEKYPNAYIQCDDCCCIYPIKRKACPRCGGKKRA